MRTHGSSSIPFPTRGEWARGLEGHLRLRATSPASLGQGTTGERLRPHLQSDSERGVWNPLRQHRELTAPQPSRARLATYPRPVRLRPRRSQCGQMQRRRDLCPRQRREFAHPALGEWSMRQRHDQAATLRGPEGVPGAAAVDAVACAGEVSWMYTGSVSSRRCFEKARFKARMCAGLLASCGASPGRIPGCAIEFTSAQSA
jgi:hypothetical protein